MRNKLEEAERLLCWQRLLVMGTEAVTMERIDLQALLELDSVWLSNSIELEDGVGGDDKCKAYSRETRRMIDSFVEIGQSAGAF